MRLKNESYLFPGAFAPVLSLDELAADLEDDAGQIAYILTDPDPLADERLELEQDLKAVNAFVASLSPRDQEIVRRIFWDDESQTEVAARIGISKMAVSKAVARIYERGRGALAAHRHRAPTH